MVRDAAGSAEVRKAPRAGGRPTTIASLATYVPPRVLTNADLALKDYKKSQDEECGTPIEHGCASPAKDSLILRPLVSPSPAPGSNDEGTDQKTSKTRAKPQEQRFNIGAERERNKWKISYY